MALTQAELSAIHQGANQIDMHNDTLRNVLSQLSSLQILGVYNTTAGHALQEEFLPTVMAKTQKLIGMLEEHSAAYRSAAGSFQNTQDNLLTHANNIANAVLQAISL